MTRPAIPVRNIYHMLAYAWDRLEESAITDVGMDDEMDLPELFGRVLAGGVSHLLKRGLDRRYEPVNEEIAGIRGRLDVGASIKRLSLANGRAWCVVDDLTPNTLPNQIVKTTLRRLASTAGLPSALEDQLRDLYRRMPGVREIQMSDLTFRRVTLGSNNRYYALLLDICALIHRNLLPGEGGGGHRFRDFTRDDGQMARLFERFVFRFYEHRLQGCEVEAPHFRWIAEGDRDAIALLPLMRTDIVLKWPGSTMVIDTKYYASALTERFGKESIRPDHLYQLMTYLRHAQEGAVGDVSGALLYPRVTRSVSADLRLLGFAVRVGTVNLNQDWRLVEAELDAFVEGVPAQPGPCQPAQELTN